MRKTLVFLGLLVIPRGGWPQAETRPEVMVLGTFHMANPGHDVHNMQADDVLSPKRQQELTQLIEALKRFHPTKIAIEAHVGTKKVGQEFSDYLAGKYALSRNENDQIGYRLAKELGHKTVYPVDEDGDFPYMRVLNYAKANGLAEKFNAMEASTGKRVQEEGNYLQSHTLLETLTYMNSDSSVARSVAAYFAFVPYGEPWDYAGPDLLAAWYQRNIRIYRNIVALIESPNDRILVIYGAGHLGWLRQDIANDATVRLRKLADLTGRQ
jgi:uncharacterized protein DUF5694